MQYVCYCYIEIYRYEVTDMEKEYDDYAKVFKAFCDPHRLKILNILKSGEHCACKLLELLDVSQSTLSHHMKILADANIVNVRKAGKWSYYTLSKEGICRVVNFLQQVSASDHNIHC